MAQFMRDSIVKDTSTVMVDMYGVMAQHTMVNGLEVKFMVKAHTPGLTAVITLDTGRRTKCTVMDK